MKRLSVVTFCLIGMMLISGPRAAMAFDWTVRLSPALERLAGNTAYSVDGLTQLTTGVPFESELKFPLNAWFISGEALIELCGRISLSIAAKTNLTTNPGQMEDTDIIYPGDEPDIYSESDSKMRALILSENLRFLVYEYDLAAQNQKMSFFAGLGYMYQYFDFDISNTIQTYPASNGSPDFYPGPTLEYTVEYLIPYLEVAGILRVNDKIGIEASFGFSPMTTAQDKDWHLLRNRYSEGTCDGQAWMSDIEANYDFTDHWSSSVVLSHLKINTSGESETYENGVFSHELDQETTSKQTSLQLAVSYGF